MKSLARALIRDRQQNAGTDTAFGRQSASPSSSLARAAQLGRYPETAIALPVPTKLALFIRLWLGVIPLLWFIFSYLIWEKVKARQPENRTECLLAFTASTLTVGFIMVAFFTMAGILPFLYMITK